MQAIVNHEEKKGYAAISPHCLQHRLLNNQQTCLTPWMAVSFRRAFVDKTTHESPVARTRKFRDSPRANSGHRANLCRLKGSPVPARDAAGSLLRLRGGDTSVALQRRSTHM